MSYWISPTAISNGGKALFSLPGITVVIIILNFTIRIVLAVAFPVYFAEAYYLEWSKFPELGYLDYPPMIAWLIAFVSKLFSGPPVLIIRLSSVVLGTATLPLIYLLSIQLFRNQIIACRAVLIGATIPMLSIAGVMALPDTPQLFFYLLFLNCLASVLRTGQGWWWSLAGISVGLALLSRVDTTLISAITGFLFVAFLHCRKNRRILGPVLALLVAALVFGPYLYWNAIHEWAGLKLQLWGRHEVLFGWKWSNPGEFLLEQLAAAGILIIFCIGSLLISSSHLPLEARQGYRFLKTQALSVLVLVSAVGLFADAHPHWTALAWPPTAVALATLWTLLPRNILSRPLRWAVPLTLTIMTFTSVVSVIGLQQIWQYDFRPLGGAMADGLEKAQARLLNWMPVENQLEQILRQQFPRGDALMFATECQTSVMLSMHHAGPPVVNVYAYIATLPVVDNGQPWYVERRRVIGKDGLLVLHPDSILIPAKLFAKAVKLPPVDIRFGGFSMRLRLYRVRGFLRHRSTIPARIK